MAQILTAEDLLSIGKKPLESEISLKTLAEFYDTYLTKKYFNYTLEYLLGDGSIVSREVKLLFQAGNLTHLLGFQHIFDGLADGSQYQGDDGYKKILEESVTMQTFKSSKSINDKYKEQRERILYFPFVHQLLSNPMTVCFSQDNVKFNNKVKVESEFIFYNQYVNRYIHLGVDYNTNQPTYFFPRTFFVRRDRKYIENQVIATITNSNIEELKESVIYSPTI